MLKLFSFSKIHISHHFRRSRLNGSSILVKLTIDYAKGADCFFLHDVEFPGTVKEQVTRLGNNSGTSEGGERGGRGMSHSLNARIRMLVSVTSDFVTYEALIVAHVLHMLSGGESDGIYVHSVNVAMKRG